MHWMVENWPVVSFCVVCLVGIGRLLQMFQSVSQTVKELESRMSDVEKRQTTFCPSKDCEAYREACEEKMDLKIATIERLIRDGDKERTQQFATIACHLASIDGYLQRERGK